jgi:hypothetical protein
VVSICGKITVYVFSSQSVVSILSKNTICAFSSQFVDFPCSLCISPLFCGCSLVSIGSLWLLCGLFFIFYHITPLASYILAVCAVRGSLCKIVMPTKWCRLTLGQMFQEPFNRCFRSQHLRKWLLKHRLKTSI